MIEVIFFIHDSVEMLRKQTHAAELLNRREG